MAAIPTRILVTGLGRQAINRLTTKAKRLGMTPENYVKELVEEDLELDRRAKSMSLREIMGPGRRVDEAELDALVKAVRERHHRSNANRRKR